MADAFVLFGRPDSIDADYQLTGDLMGYTTETGTPAIRVWRPHRQVAFGPRDTNADGYESARNTARERGYSPVERRVGGRAVAYTGSTVAFVRCRPVEDLRRGLQQRYEEMSSELRAALRDLGVEAESGEPPESFCPGSHSLQANGKIAGIAQRVTNAVAVVSGILVVSDHEEIAAVLEPIYADLGVAFDPDSVGSIRNAGGTYEYEPVLDTVVAALSDSTGAETVKLQDVARADDGTFLLSEPP